MSRIEDENRKSPELAICRKINWVMSHLTFCDGPRNTRIFSGRGLVNTAAHWDCPVSGEDIRMTMYNDHIKSLGLGKPPGVVTVENIQA